MVINHYLGLFFCLCPLRSTSDPPRRRRRREAPLQAPTRKCSRCGVGVRALNLSLSSSNAKLMLSRADRSQSPSVTWRTLYSLYLHSRTLRSVCKCLYLMLYSPVQIQRCAAPTVHWCAVFAVLTLLDHD